MRHRVRQTIASHVTLKAFTRRLDCVLLRLVPGSDRVVPLIDHLVRMAIANHRLIQFKYGSVTRVAEPHDYGIQHGELRLLVYQIRSTPFSRGWRLLDPAKITELVVLEKTFAGSRQQTDQHHYQWETVFARVV